MNAWNACIATIETGGRRGPPALQKPYRVHIHLHPNIAGHIYPRQPFAQKPLYADIAPRLEQKPPPMPAPQQGQRRGRWTKNLHPIPYRCSAP